MIKQRTVETSVTATGVGLHKGEKVTLTLRPAPENTGIVFRRIDLDPVVEFKITPELVGDTTMCTCLVNEQGVRLSTTEHLLAAVSALAIDNLVIDVDSAEIPIMDGSSLPFIYLLQQAGIEAQNSAKRFIRVKRTIRVEEGDKWAEIKPANEFKINFAIDFDHPVISQSQQVMTLSVTPQNFINEISRARTFGFMHDIEYLHANNLALGGSMDNAVVLDEYKVLNTDGLRYDDEFVKHKILDAVGDLYMAGHPLLGEVSAYKSGHALNNLLLCELMSQQDAWEFVTFENAADAPKTVLAAQTA
ncbi:UDP-3-O-acyl-N-acetylglucosamine deacetylase [Flocculibacter collagenilyticus]|uniref:UDP-3-O-acyl-N-acetylglucosamine deacetylase n=1 Tax=Flocculibacter collagenilyticus TaxID=2744479 RepID=UPI0018F4B805|nr:UDP-3-O-acyl-N-acetylglucosamine deacetylase [Flocculibacter collagenilyticus]